jgi:phospholipase/carboxylesterase
MYNECPEIKSVDKTPSKLMVFLHGVGSDGNDLISLVPYMQDSLREYHFISPHGIEEYDMAPFGRQWFSLQDRSRNTITKLVQNNAPKVQAQINQKQNELGIENKDTVIFGFSQGTMMGIYLTLTQEKSYHAMIGFSGRLISPQEPKNTSTPICLIHGLNDDIVEANESRKTAQYCQKHDINHELLLIPNLTHSIDGQGIEFSLRFLQKLK